MPRQCVNCTCICYIRLINLTGYLCQKSVWKITTFLKYSSCINIYLQVVVTDFLYILHTSLVDVIVVFCQHFYDQLSLPPPFTGELTSSLTAEIFRFCLALKASLMKNSIAIL